MIIVAGCSWACGEWSRGDCNEGVTHGGLSQYIQERGDQCINLGVAFGSNLQTAQKVQGWLDRYPDTKVEKILIFQTEYDRDYRMKFEEDYIDVESIDSISSRMLARFYSRLTEISRQARAPVYVIGGVSDTVRFENFEKCYPGVKIACQSMTNLLINDCENVDIPVLSWYTKASSDMLETIKQQLSLDQVEKLFHEIDRGLERDNLVFGHPEYFWPDGCHPNRFGHKKLFDFLCVKGII